MLRHGSVRTVSIILLLGALSAVPARAQQRPLVTEDAETIGAGRVLVEAGVDHGRDVEYTVSGLSGNLTRIPSAGISVGLSAIAELQIDGGFDRLAISSRKTAPLSSLVTVTGDSTRDVADVVVATKIRVVPEGAARPAFGIRFATKLPNASNESGLGTDSMDFYMSILVAKALHAVRVVGNVGSGILSDPTNGQRQNDVLTYGASVVGTVTPRVAIVGEVNGRRNLRSDGPLPGSESRSVVRLGGRFTQGALRWDAALLFGLTDIDPSIGFTAGVTYTFNAFTLP